MVRIPECLIDAPSSKTRLILLWDINLTDDACMDFQDLYNRVEYRAKEENTREEPGATGSYPPRFREREAGDESDWPPS